MDSRREVLALLLENARQTTDDIARQTGLDEEEVADLVADLEATGVVRGYRAVVDWDSADGERVLAEVELNVELDRETGYDDIARRISKFPEVRRLLLISGDYDFHIEVEGDSMREVSNFVADEIAPIPEITQTVTHFVMETYKDHGIVFEEDGDDDRLSVSP